MNGVNIDQFQFEYDLTWMSFFQNSKGKTYARYGGREDVGPESHLNQASLVATMIKVLDLHKSGSVKPTNRYEPLPDTVAIPDDLPGVKKLQARRKESCIHCHEVKGFQLKALRPLGQLKKSMVFTYPSPKRVGIQLDSKDQTLIKSIVQNSEADKAGLKANDRIKKLDRQAIHTFADATRVLELAPSRDAKLNVQYERAGNEAAVNITLTSGWKTAGDPSWRESSHVVGPNSGFWAVRLNSKQRQANKIGDDKLGLKITVIWGKWARAAKLKNGDVVVEIDGQSTDMSIKQLQSYLHMKKNWGESVTLNILRKGKPMSVKMKLPSEPQE